MYGGALAAVPLPPEVLMLYYDLPAFRRDGLAVPQTWEDLAALVSELITSRSMHACMHTASGCTLSGILYKAPVGFNPHHSAFLAAV